MRAVPLFSPEGRRMVNAGPSWREHPAYYRDEPPEDIEAQQEEEFLLSLPEAWATSEAQGGLRDA